MKREKGAEHYYFRNCLNLCIAGSGVLNILIVSGKELCDTLISHFTVGWNFYKKKTVSAQNFDIFYQEKG
jgi:hypothetical protein